MSNLSSDLEVCGHTWDSERLSCTRPKGHSGSHGDGRGVWSDSAGSFPGEVPLPERWLPFKDAVDWVQSRLMTAGSGFVNRHWDCKYIDARIDMRTGAMYFTAGNRHDRG